MFAFFIQVACRSQKSRSQNLIWVQWYMGHISDLETMSQDIAWVFCPAPFERLFQSRILVPSKGRSMVIRLPGSGSPRKGAFFHHLTYAASKTFKTLEALQLEGMLKYTLPAPMGHLQAGILLPLSLEKRSQPVPTSQWRGAGWPPTSSPCGTF